jgi:hypothetical protein
MSSHDSKLQIGEAACRANSLSWKTSGPAQSYLATAKMLAGEGDLHQGTGLDAAQPSLILRTNDLTVAIEAI